MSYHTTHAAVLVFVVVFLLRPGTCSIMTINLTDHATLAAYVPGISRTECTTDGECAATPPPPGTTVHGASACGRPRCFDPSALASAILSSVLPIAFNVTGVSVVSIGRRFCAFELALEDPWLLPALSAEALSIPSRTRHLPSFLAAFGCRIEGKECIRGLCGARAHNGTLPAVPYGCHAAIDDPVLKRFVLSPASRPWIDGPPTPFPHAWSGEKMVYDPLFRVGNSSSGRYATYAAYGFRGETGFSPVGTPCTLGPFAAQSASCNDPVCNSAGFCGSRPVSGGIALCPLSEVLHLPASSDPQCFDTSLIGCIEAVHTYGGFLAPENAGIATELRMGVAQPPPIIAGILPLLLSGEPLVPVYFMQPDSPPYRLLADPWDIIRPRAGVALVTAPLRCSLFSQASVRPGGTSCVPSSSATPVQVGECASATLGYCHTHADLGPVGQPFLDGDGALAPRAIPLASTIGIGECRRRLSPAGSACATPIAESLAYAVNTTPECTYSACTGSGACAIHVYPEGTPCAASQCSSRVCGPFGVCDTSVHLRPGTVCDDGDPCTQGDACDGNGTCSGEESVRCVRCADDSDCECTGDDLTADFMRICSPTGRCALPWYNQSTFSGVAPPLQPWQGLGAAPEDVVAYAEGGRWDTLRKCSSTRRSAPCVRTPPSSQVWGRGFCGDGGACLPFLPLRRYVYLPLLERRLANATATAMAGNPLQLPEAAPCLTLTQFSGTNATANATTVEWNTSVVENCVWLERNVTRTSPGICTSNNTNCSIMTPSDQGYSPVPEIFPLFSLSAYYYGAGTVCAGATVCSGVRRCAGFADSLGGECQPPEANLTGRTCNPLENKCVRNGKCSPSGECLGGERIPCAQRGLCAGLSSCVPSTGVCSLPVPAPFRTPCPSPCYPYNPALSPPGPFCSGYGACVSISIPESPDAACSLNGTTECTTSKCSDSVVVLPPNSVWIANVSAPLWESVGGSVYRSVPQGDARRCQIFVRTRSGGGARFPRSCTDRDACTLTDRCSGAGVCVSTGGNVVCQNASVCTTVSPCNPATGTCPETFRPAGTPCAPPTTCTLGGTCNGSYSCLIPSVSCDYLLDGLLSDNATSAECIDAVPYCNTTDGSCRLRGSGRPVVRPCFDGNGCTVSDRCDPLVAGSCLPGSARVCPEPSDQCRTSVGSACIPGAPTDSSSDGTFSCTYPVAVGKECDDGKPCTRESFCVANGSCVGAPPPPVPPPAYTWARGMECVALGTACPTPEIYILPDTVRGETRRCACASYPAEPLGQAVWDAAGCVGRCYGGSCLVEAACVPPRVADKTRETIVAFEVPECVCPYGTVEPDCDLAPTPGWIEYALGYLVLFVLAFAAVSLTLVVLAVLLFYLVQLAMSLLKKAVGVICSCAKREAERELLIVARGRSGSDGYYGEVIAARSSDAGWVGVDLPRIRSHSTRHVTYDDD